MEKQMMRSLYYNPDTDTVDIWLGNPSTESYAEPLTENLVSKRNIQGEAIGFEIITLNKFNSEDLKKMPEKARLMLRESAARLSIASRAKE
jgi:hypothetical protein